VKHPYLFALPLVIFIAGLAVAQDNSQPDADATEVEAVPEPPEWESSLTIGLSGASGNTDNQDFYAAFSAIKNTDAANLEFKADYRRSEEDNETTEDRFYALGRYTWKFTDSKWGIYAQATLEHDRFKSWDERITVSVGPSYRFIDNEKTYLEGRAGVGVVGTYGGDAPDDTDLEALLGVTLRHKFTEKFSFKGTVDLFPNLSESGEYRLIGDASIEYKMSETWALTAGVQDIYDSDPELGDEKNDFYYYIALSLTF